MPAPRLRDRLRRLRPVAAPGPAGPAGVPADVTRAVEAELAPVFAALDDAQREAQRRRARAAAAARARRAEATARGEQLRAGARTDAAAQRADAARQRVALEAAERDRLLAAADAEAAAVRHRADARLPALVDRVLDEVRRGAWPHEPAR
ncbi:MAG: hypothetical protein IPM45_15880 [Acidimicrobiales bacterium]|nr:hypothetical protein [Acidimicrobiales bacterium]